MQVPVILYDIDNNALTKNFIAKSNSFFVRSFQNFGIKIIETSESQNKIYSVKQNPNSTSNDDLLLIDSGKEFQISNYGYTLYLENDIQIMVWNASGQNVIYNVKLVNENFEPEHYNDILVNNGLPNYKQLLPAVISSNKAELIKRLLLDFKNIVKYKGTIIGITKFLNLIGFNPESIVVYAEFVTPNGIKTINPNKLTDKKTGDYHVLYDNFLIDSDDKYTIKNLPKFINNITDLEEFFEKLFYAISLANVYFTLPEQDISFFGIQQIANSEQYLSFAGNSYLTHFQNPHWFTKNIVISIYKEYTESIKKYIVKNNLSTSDNRTESSEIKFTRALPIVNQELFLIDEEIFDDSEYDFNVRSIFANLLNLIVDSHNTYVRYTIEKLGNPFSKIDNNQFVGEEPLHIKYIAKTVGEYQINIWITDYHNNQEKYTYNYFIDEAIADIDFDIYNSSILSETKNKLSTGISSNDTINTVSENYVLPLNLVPNLLNTYFDVDISGNELVRFLGNNKNYMLPEINGNFIVNKCSELPIDLMDNWLNIISFRKQEGFNLRLRHINPDNNHVEISNIGSLNIEPDENLFVTELFITETINGTVEENYYIFVSTQSIGIDISKNLFDLVLHNEITDEIISIFDIADLTNKKIPVNYDFPLFHREYDDNTDTDNYPIDTEDLIIESIFPKLTTESFNVKLGDVIAAIPNKNYVTNQLNIIWEIRDGFTNELLHETRDLMLKYRVKENTIYNIILKFMINNGNYVIDKKSIISSL